MRLFHWIFFASLAAYSAVLIVAEMQTSQDFIRHYFSDIEGPRPFFAINTTLSTFLLAGAAILLAFAASSGGGGRTARSRVFLWSQASMLSFLAFDDRFQLHEALAYRIGIGDHFIMAAWGFIEAALILALARKSEVTIRTAALVATGVGFFGVMMVFDAFVPHDMVLRLSIEDLAKSWAAAFFFSAAWCHSRAVLGLDRKTPTLADWTHNLPIIGAARTPDADPAGVTK